MGRGAPWWCELVNHPGIWLWVPLAGCEFGAHEMVSTHCRLSIPRLGVDGRGGRGAACCHHSTAMFFRIQGYTIVLHGIFLKNCSSQDHPDATSMNNMKTFIGTRRASR